MDTQIIEKITQAITYVFKSDGTLPGLTTAWLPHNKSFYVSIVRWVNGDKVVVCSSQDPDLNQAFYQLAGKFLALHPPVKTPVEELAALMDDPVAETTTDITVMHLNPLRGTIVTNGNYNTQ